MYISEIIHLGNFYLYNENYGKIFYKRIFFSLLCLYLENDILLIIRGFCMKDNKYISNSIENFKVFLKWLFIATVIGVIVGVVGVSFHIAIEKATEIRLENSFLIFLLPLGGAFIAWLYKVSGMEKDRGTNFVLSAVRNNDILRIKTAPLIYVSTFITHLFGGSSGREGAALQLGGSIASKIGRVIGLDEKDERVITMCGMSAGFSALFGTPITSVIFSMEVITVGVMHYSAIVPCVIASIVAIKIAMIFKIPPTAFDISLIPSFEFITFAQVIVLSILCGVVSIVFCVLMHDVSSIYKKYIPNTILRGFVGGIIVVILTLIVGSYDYNGAGMNIIENALLGNAKPEAFIIKMVLTALTLGAGFKGGEIVPSFFIGSTFGCFIGGLLGLNTSFASAIGLVAIFCGVTNCPISSIILSIELFGAEGVIFFALACGVSYMLSGYYGLYSEQKIMYSKTKPEFIDKNTY